MYTIILRLILLLALAGVVAGCGEAGGSLPEVDFKVVRVDAALRDFRQALTAQNKPCREAYAATLAENRRAIMALTGSSPAPEAYAVIPDAQIDAFLIDSAGLCRTFAAPAWGQMFDSLLAAFPPDYDLKGQLTGPFARVKAAFPQFRAPDVYAVSRGYDPREDWGPQYQRDRLVLTDSSLVVNLEYFAGPKFPFSHPRIPVYVRNRNTPAHLPAAVLREIGYAIKPELQKPNPALIELMLDAGKILYFIERTAPEMPDSIVIGYTAEQTVVAKASDRQIFEKLVPLFYEQNLVEYEWALRDGPFTDRFGKGAPPRLGEYLGWQIVRAYMDRNDETTLPQLFALDAGTILKGAAFKP